MREGIARADLGCELRRIIARAEQEDRRQRDVVRHRMHVAERMVCRKTVILEQQQFLEAVEKIVVVGDVLPAPQRDRGDMIGARRAPDAEIDAAGITALPAP